MEVLLFVSKPVASHPYERTNPRYCGKRRAGVNGEADSAARTTYAGLANFAG